MTDYDLLARHFIRHHEDAAVSADRSGHRKAGARVAACRFDDRLPPGFRRFCRSAAWSIATAGRSFTLLPGFTYSTFAKTRHGAPSVTLFNLTSGVLPIAASASSQKTGPVALLDGTVVAIGAAASARRTACAYESFRGRAPRRRYTDSGRDGVQLGFATAHSRVCSGDG